MEVRTEFCKHNDAKFLVKLQDGTMSEIYDSNGNPLKLKLRSNELELKKEIAELREMLYMAHTNGQGYNDDGELQDNRKMPWIDFKRDTVEQIKNSLMQRGRDILKANNANT